MSNITQCPRNPLGEPSCHITEHNVPEFPAMVIIGLVLLTIFIFIRAIDNSGSSRPRSSSIIFLSAQTSEDTEDPIVPPMYRQG